MTNMGGSRTAFARPAGWKRELAAKLGAMGLAGRASGVSCDLRVDHPWPPYDRLKAGLVTHVSGDVAARVQVRFDEIAESLRLCRMLLEDLASGPIRTEVPVAECRSSWNRRDRRMARAGDDCSRKLVRLAPSGAATRTTRPGKTGRCSNMRSLATSFPISP